MDNVKVKICDIRSPEIASICAQEGADFLGLHQIKAPLSDAKLSTFNEIKAAAPKLPLVLVTKEDDLDRLLEMCLQFEWDYIQMHFPTTSQDLISFKNRLRMNGSSARIINVIETGSLLTNPAPSIIETSDYLLFDSSMRGGTGIMSSQEAQEKIASIALNIPYFVAGGLRPENVVEVIKTTHPFAVDVQSGVEDTNRKHEKDPRLIKAFINAVRSFK